jgi:hypothetical protein
MPFPPRLPPAPLLPVFGCILPVHRRGLYALRPPLCDAVPIKGHPSGTADLKGGGAWRWAPAERTPRHLLQNCLLLALFTAEQKSSVLYHVHRTLSIVASVASGDSRLYNLD